MLKAGKKHPLRETLGENLSEPLAKRGRFDNIVLLRNDRRQPSGANGPSRDSSQRIIRAAKRKRPIGEDRSSQSEPIEGTARLETDENDIISQLTKEFKKARLRPVFFTISSFIEQTVDEVGFTMADEPETEVTIRLTIPKKIEPANDNGIEESDHKKDVKDADSTFLNVLSNHAEDKCELSAVSECATNACQQLISLPEPGVQGCHAEINNNNQLDDGPDLIPRSFRGANVAELMT